METPGAIVIRSVVMVVMVVMTTLVLPLHPFSSYCVAVEMGPKNELPDDTLFQDPHAFCEGCYGMVTEVDNLMSLWKGEGGSLEDHIDTALHATCNTDRLRTYVLSPPKMMRLCTGIRAHYHDQIGLAILTHYTRKEVRTVDRLFEEVCRKVIPACHKNITPMSVTRQESRRKAAEEEENDTKTVRPSQQDTKKKKQEEEEEEEKEKKKIKKNKKKNQKNKQGSSSSATSKRNVEL